MPSFKKIANSIKIPKDTTYKIVSHIVKVYFNFKKHFYYCKNVNYPKCQSLFAIWHAHQCGTYALENKERLYAMISRSRDGDIIATAAESLGYHTVRGSKTRGGAPATLELLDKLKEGNNGMITIDGPKGPKRIVKKGIIEIARLSGVPIVPMTWYSPSKGFLKFNTWDEFRFPICGIQMVALYGDPIHVKEDATDEEIEAYRQEVENNLNALYERVKKEFKTLVKS